MADAPSEQLPAQIAPGKVGLVASRVFVSIAFADEGICNTMDQAIGDDCAFSFHQGGAQFVFCDGSVHFIKENISMETYCNMHAMNDGQPLGNY